MTNNIYTCIQNVFIFGVKIYNFVVYYSFSKSLSSNCLSFNDYSTSWKLAITIKKSGKYSDIPNDDDT